MKAEAELLNGQANCPELLRLYDYFEENNTVYVVMELMEGIPLRTYILRGLRLTEEDVRVVGLLLLKAVKVLHNAGLLHLDISPDNIMIADTIKLIDFGAVGKAGRKEKVLFGSGMAILRRSNIPTRPYLIAGRIYMRGRCAVRNSYESQAASLVAPNGR